MALNKNLRRGVGLIILTDLPKSGRVAVLQTRGFFNTEEGRPQYFAGGCQVSVYGGLEKGETIKSALIREAKEELGPATSVLINKKSLKKIYSFRRENEAGVIYAALLPAVFLKSIRLGPDSGGIRFAKPSDLKNALDLSKFKKGVKDRFRFAVFPDTKRAVQLAFKIFSHRPPIHKK